MPLTTSLASPVAMQCGGWRGVAAGYDGDCPEFGRNANAITMRLQRHGFTTPSTPG
ncbi:hypothetical protein [Nocardia vermiculata]|uniref:Uncharacterized protein n=1 Tax=Nocardia vermiculata TaxID=257274 RepID=A0A846XZW3_9NOCA|nr:hypothetical protein [Nocardia vermiculata]NKY51382.1 hypothetical protein [Nocardia vermiculata]